MSGTSTHRRGWVLGSALVLLGAAGGIWLQARQGPPAPAGTTLPAAPEAPAPAAAAAQELSPTALPASLPPLPPSDVPFDITTAALQARADAGDRAAACRLGVGLLRCEAVRRREGFLSTLGYDSAEHFANGGDLAMANRVDEQRLWNLEQLAQCKDIDDLLRGRGTEYLARAARAGSPYAMVVYGSGLHLRVEPGFAATQEFDDWRRDGATMLQRALQAGEPTAVAVLTRGYASDLDYPEALVPNDPIRAHAMEVLSARLFGGVEMNIHGRTLDAGERSRARQLAERIHAESFGGRRFEGADGINSPLDVAPRPGARSDPCGTG